MSPRTFGKLLKQEIARRGWQDFTLDFVGDPSGDDMKETSDHAPSQIMRSVGITVVAAPTNDPLVRIEAVSALMSDMKPSGPTLNVSPNCHHLIAGFRGAYHFKPMTGGARGQYDTRPAKNRSSHPHDALQYGVLRCGAWRPIINQNRKTRSTTIDRSGSPFQRAARRTAGRLRERLH